MADAKDPALPTKTMRAPDFQAMWRDTADWFAVHYMQILIAIGAAIVIYLLLATLNSFIHTADGWTAVMPYGLTVSVLTVVVMIATAWLGARHD